MPFEESRVLAMPLDGAPAMPEGDIRLLNPGDPRWYRAEAGLAAYDTRTLETLKTILSLIVPEAKGLVVHGRDGTPAAAALAVNAGGIGVYLNVVADRARRRQGFGTAVMRAALAWTRERGATNAAIQVVSANQPAIALWRAARLRRAVSLPLSPAAQAMRDRCPACCSSSPAPSSIPTTAR